ncbi:hypothetical protein DSO57_1021758 [Entomophthora muscae]|uniref:Uncharacterized protein n=1 Tax=Entomophthora muscae TaxID=34485 RepID=A0ACC2RUP4_9FUNG|nr:hypothetical protein DSO57_1021758 [Entomophthora muscae]
MGQPKTWPDTKVIYTPKYRFINKHTQKAFEEACKKAQETIKTPCPKSLDVLAYQPESISDRVKIRSLRDFPKHPAFPFYGLFSNRSIPPNSLIVKYTGLVTPSLEYDLDSDYVLSFLGVFAVDASKFGNEGRFVNDYRGVASKPNVAFKEFFDLNTSQLSIGIFSLKDPIPSDSELLTNYGKSFWKQRGLLKDS